MKDILQNIRASFEWWKLWKSLPVFTWIKASEHYRKGEYKKAAELYLLGIEKKPSHKAIDCACLDYSYCLYKLSRYEESIKQLELLVERSVLIEEVYTLLIKQYCILGLSHLSSEVLEKAKVLIPESVNLRTLALEVAIANDPNLQNILVLKSDVERLREKLLLDDERMLLVDTALAHFEFAHGDLSLADQMIARLLATGKAPFEVHLMRAERFIENGRIFHAREQLRKASLIRPRDPRADLLLAKSYLLPGSFCEPKWAVDLSLQACKKTNWQNPECLISLAKSHEMLDDKEQAEVFYSYANRIQMTRNINIKSVFRAKLEVEKLQQLMH